jgi:hypothetical protein
MLRKSIRRRDTTYSYRDGRSVNKGTRIRDLILNWPLLLQWQIFVLAQSSAPPCADDASSLCSTAAIRNEGGLAE